MRHWSEEPWYTDAMAERRASAREPCHDHEDPRAIWVPLDGRPPFPMYPCPPGFWAVLEGQDRSARWAGLPAPGFHVQPCADCGQAPEPGGVLCTYCAELAGLLRADRRQRIRTGLRIAAGMAFITASVLTLVLPEIAALALFWSVVLAAMVLILADRRP